MTIKMINKREALEIVGMRPTNPKREDFFNHLTQYENPFNANKVFREDDVIQILDSFVVVSPGDQTTTA